MLDDMTILCDLDSNEFVQARTLHVHSTSGQSHESHMCIYFSFECMFTCGTSCLSQNVYDIFIYMELGQVPELPELLERLNEV